MAKLSDDSAPSTTGSATSSTDLPDRTNETSETVPAGSTTNSTTAGITKTAPAVDAVVATPPKRWALRNGSTGTITVSYPDTAGATTSLTMLAGEVLTFRQKTTLGYAAESGNKTLSSLDARFPKIAGGNTLTGTWNFSSASVTGVSASGVARLKTIEGQPFYAYGHSYNVTGGASLFPARLQSRHGTANVTQRGSAGYTMVQTLAAIQTNWTVNSRGFVTLMSLLNDVNNYGAASTAGVATSRESFRSCLAYLTASAVLASNDTAFAYGTGWTSGATTTNGSYVDFGWTGDAAYLLVPFVTSAGSTVTITRTGDGATVATVTTGGYSAAFTGAVKLSGFGAGAHTVRVTLTSGGSLGVTGAAIPADTPPVVVWYQEAPVLGYGTPKATSLTADYIPACATVTPDFPTCLTATSTGWDNATMLLTDNIHPNDKGHSFIADRLEVALSAMPFTQGLDFQIRTTAGTAYSGTTPSYFLSGPPSQVGTVVATPGSAQVVLTWSAPASNGSTITDYVVQYRTTTGPGSWVTFTDGVSATTGATVTGLTNGTSYDFQVAAVNGNGQGTYSAAVTASPTTSTTVPGAPTGLTATPGNAQVALSWTAPASNGGAAITDYVIQYRTPNGSGAWTTFSHTASTTTSATVTGLTNSSAYGFQVAAVNSVGTGAFTSEATATPSTLVVSDTFTRADGALGVATSGQSWVIGAGTFSVASNVAKCTAGSDAQAYIDAGISNFTMQLTLAAVSSNFARALFRYADSANYWMVQVLSGGNFLIYKRVAGTFTSVGTVTKASAAGDVLTIIGSGSSLSVQVNAVTPVTLTDSFNNTATKYGFGASTGDATMAFDNFSVG